jgi:hypothetical protein
MYNHYAADVAMHQKGYLKESELLPQAELSQRLNEYIETLWPLLEDACYETENPSNIPSQTELQKEVERLKTSSPSLGSSINSDLDFSTGGPFGRLRDFEEGRVPYEPPGRALFKYGKYLHLKALVEYGQIRISPIDTFHDTVRYSGTVADSSEGRVRPNATEYDIGMENPHFGWQVSKTSPHVAMVNGITVSGNTFRDGGFRKAYIWCAADSELPRDAVTKMSNDYDAVATVKDWKSFFVAIGHALRKHGCSEILIGSCDYSGALRPVIWEHPGNPSWKKTLPRAFQQIPKSGFEEQREIRMVFYHPTPSTAFNLVVPEIVGLAELKKI